MKCIEVNEDGTEEEIDVEITELKMEVDENGQYKETTYVSDIYDLGAIQSIEASFTITDEISIVDYGAYNNLSPEKKAECERFIGMFQSCPVCCKPNHPDYLKSTYCSKIEYDKRIMEKLLPYVREERELPDNIRLGIPCCECYSKIILDAQYKRG